MTQLTRRRLRAMAGRGAGLLAAVLALTGIAVATPAVASADGVGKYIALTGVVVDQPHSWASTTVHLDWQADGNLVLYCIGSNKVVWASGTNNSVLHQIDFGDGGNSGLAAGPITIFEYEMGPVIFGWYPQWGTNGAPGDHAYVQNDGNFVVYASNGKALWATNTEGKC